MPQMTEEELKILSEYLKNAKPLTLNITADEENKARQECDAYLDSKISDISGLIPLSIYYILSKMSSSDQIQFIKDNINYIRKHDNDIFLYGLEAPKELAYYFSYETLIQIYKIDKELFEKIMQGNMENIFNGFIHEDYLSFFQKFKSYINKIEVYRLFHILDKHNRCLFDKFDLEEINNVIELQHQYNKEFLSYFIENYKNKISSFSPRKLLSFISYIEDIEEYKKWVLENKQKLELAFNEIADYDFEEYLSEHTNYQRQEILFSNFLESISNKLDIRKIISSVSSEVIFELYDSNKEIFDKMSLDDWIKLCAKKKEFNENYKKILDNYKLSEISKLFDVSFYVIAAEYEYYDTAALEYIETKYRNSIVSPNIIPIDKISSIFSEDYFNNLKYLQIHFKNKTLQRNSKEYEENLAKFIIYLESNHIVLDFNDTNLKEINQFYYRIIMGHPISSIFKLKSIEEITISNRLGKKEFKVSDFTVEQLEKFNVKEYKQLLAMRDKEKFYDARYKNLILKLLFLVGFDKAKKILRIASDIPTLEHLVGNVDVKNIQMDRSNNPILNNRILNLLFSNYELLEKMLIDKDNDIYKYFPRIFNEWEFIKINGKDKSLAIIIDYLKSDEISLLPNYYRLEGLFKLIGSSNRIVEETLKLHDEMLKRTVSTIPKVKNQIGEYTYEVLDLQNMESLSVGNQTDCCFTVLGDGYSCLKHATTSKNGRILVVKKNNELLAHSWFWRNGNLLCLDNIEISKAINEVNFLEVYIDFANEIIKKSFENEGADKCIKNVTIGYTNFDKRIVGLHAFPCFIFKKCDLESKNFGSRIGNNRKIVSELPQPIEKVEYSDSKNVQYLIKGNGIFELYQSNYLYSDQRDNPLYFESSNEYSDEFITKFNQKINALIYIRLMLNNQASLYKPIDIRNYKSAICNNDWFITESDNEIDSFIYSFDVRAYSEMESFNVDIQKCKQKF